MVTRIIEAGRWKPGDPDIMGIFDAGYEPTRLAWLLRDLAADRRLPSQQPCLPGTKNRRPATRHDVGKAARRFESANAAAG